MGGNGFYVTWKRATSMNVPMNETDVAAQFEWAGCVVVVRRENINGFLEQTSDRQEEEHQSDSIEKEQQTPEN